MKRNARSLVGRGAAAVALVAAGLSFATGPASAAPITIVVTGTADGHGAGTLRAALDQANAGTFDAVTIELPAGDYPLDVCAPSGDDANGGGDLDATGATNPLTLVGLGTGATIRQTCAGERVLDQLGTGRLTLQGVTITGGRIGGRPALGGGVLARGPVTLDHAALLDNVAQGDTMVLPATKGFDAAGGGLWAAGAVIVQDSAVSQNTARGGNGLTHGPFPPAGSGAGGHGRGGGIHTASTLAIASSTFSGNDALGGAFANRSSGGSARGGAADAVAVTATASTFDHNTAIGADGNSGQSCNIVCLYLGAAGGTASGGALAATSATLTGVEAHDNVASGGLGAVSYESTGDLVRSAGVGGAVEATTAGVIQGTYTGNVASSAGGAIAAETLSVDGSSLTGNTARVAGGAVSGQDVTIADATFGSNTGANGGAVRGTTVQIEDSRFEGNQSGFAQPTPKGQRPDAKGGAVAADAGVTASRSSFVGNALQPPGSCDNPLDGCAATAVLGGGIWSGGDVHLDAVTVAGNTLDGSAQSSPVGGGGVAATGAVTAVNSTITDNRSTDDGVPAAGGGIRAGSAELRAVTFAGHDGSSGIDVSTLAVSRTVLLDQVNGVLCAAPVATSAGYNWADEATCGLTAVTDHVGPEAVLLGPLQDNGGPTPTRLPAPPSPIVDAVPVASCAVSVDQRGVVRPQGAACDIGATEIIGATLGPSDLGVTITGPAAGGVGQSVDLAVTMAAAGGVGYPTMTITLPTGWGTLADVTAPAGVVCSRPTATTVECNLAAGLAAGASAVVTVAVTLPDAPLVQVTADIVGLGPDTVPGNDHASHTITPVPSAHVVVFDAQLDAGGLHQGGQQTLRLYPDSEGPSPLPTPTAADPLHVVFDLPADVTIVAGSWPANWTCTQVAADVTCDETAGPHQTLILKIAAADTALAQQTEHHASATMARANDPAPGELLTWTLEVEASADLAGAPDFHSIGGSTFSGSVAITNAGPSPASGAELRLSLPGSTSADSITAPPGWTCTWDPSVSGGLLTCRRAGDLPVGASETITVIGDAPPGLTEPAARAHYQVLATTFDPNRADNAAFVPLPFAVGLPTTTTTSSTTSTSTTSSTTATTIPTSTTTTTTTTPVSTTSSTTGPTTSSTSTTRAPTSTTSSTTTPTSSSTSSTGAPTSSTSSTIAPTSTSSSSSTTASSPSTTAVATTTTDPAAAVAGANLGATTGTLPVTGSGSTWPGVLGIALVALGSVVLALRRRHAA